MFFFGKRKQKSTHKRSRSLLVMMNENQDEDEYLLDASGQQRSPFTHSLHPKVWSFLGVLYIILGISQAILAITWFWYLGVAIGLSIAKLGSTLLGIGITGGGSQTSLPPSSTFKQKLQHCGFAIILWGATKIQRLFFYLRWPIVGYGVFVALLLTIRITSPDPHLVAFPDSCPANNKLGCSRVAVDQPHGPRGVTPLFLPASLNATQAAIQGWIWAQAGSRIVYATPGFIHARVVTPIWGFADDFFVSLRCEPDHKQVVVETQGQLRIGKSDLGVNGRRNKNFFAWLKQKQDELPEEECLAAS